MGHLRLAEGCRTAEESGSDDAPSPDEADMDERRLAYSRAKPLAWRDALMGEAQGILGGLRDGSDREVGDEVDGATREADQALALRTRDRCRKLVRKIDKALARIEDGTQGDCEETGEPIALARLERRPVANRRQLKPCCRQACPFACDSSVARERQADSGHENPFRSAAKSRCELSSSVGDRSRPTGRGKCRKKIRCHY